MGHFSARHFAALHFATNHLHGTGEAVAVAAVQVAGGGYPRRRKEVSEKERRWTEEEYRLRLEEIYDELHGLKKPVEAEAAEIIAPFVSRPAKWLPPASKVDFAALAESVQAAERLIALYEDYIRDEEEAFFMLMAA